MNNLIRIAIIGVIAVGVLAIALFILSVTEPANTASTRIVFTSAEPTDVQSVSVKNSSGEFRFFFDFEEEGYVLDDIPPYIADIEAFFDFMANSAQLSAIMQIPEHEVDLQEMGLTTPSTLVAIDFLDRSQPSALVTIDFFDGTHISLNIGNIEPISGNYYATATVLEHREELPATAIRFDSVYLIPRAIAEQFLLPKTQIISRFVTPPLAISSPLSAIRDITFAGGSLEFPVSILITTGGSESTRLAAMSFGAATHIVKGAGVHQLDQTYGVHILGSLFGIEAVSIAGYNLSEDEVAAFGFDNPYMSIDYDMINGIDVDLRHMQLRIAEAESGLYYATLVGSGVVYNIRREAFLDIEYERLPVRWFLTPLIMDLSAITIETPNMQYRFDINSSDPLNPIITHEGQTLDTTLFRSFFRLLTSAAHDDVYLGILPQPGEGETPLVTITYEYLNPEKAPDTMALYTGESRRANVFINGVGEFAMKDLFAERVSEGTLNLIAGNNIEENW